MKDFLFSLLSDDDHVLLFLTLGVLLVATVVGVVLFLTRKTDKIRFVLYGCLIYALLLAVFCFVIDIMKHYNENYAEENWLDLDALVPLVLIPLLVFFALTLIYFVLALVFKKRAFYKGFMKIGGAVLCVVLLGSLVCLGRYYSLKINDDGYYNSDTASVKQIALYLSALLVIGCIALCSAFSKSDFTFNSRALAYAGICVATSFSLSYVKLFSLPQGGSVTLVSLLPLVLYSYVFGAKKGCVVGAVYGVLQAVQSPWLIHPAQFLLDYPVAFATVGFAGLFRKETHTRLWFGLGTVLTGIARFVCHVLSGVFAFSAYADGENVLVYSLAYNSFVLVDILLVCVVGVVLLCNGGFRKKVESL